MEVFTIVANEVIGLSATECTLIQFSYNPEQIHDPETVLRSAVMDYLKTDEGKRQLEINCGCWNWGDVDDIPGSFFLNYGLTKIAPPDVNVVVDRNENFMDDYEYIKDKENNPTIYNGLPLHTEYRVFVDFDTKEILGASPYWRSDVMKNEFKKVSSPQERHDYVVYKMHEDILNQRYHESVQTVLAELKKVIPRIELTGQWSVDVMRNGNDYYIIDMALAENSALNDCVPSNRLRAYPQQWLPGESNN